MCNKTNLLTTQMAFSIYVFLCLWTLQNVVVRCPVPFFHSYSTFTTIDTQGKCYTTSKATHKTFMESRQSMKVTEYNYNTPTIVILFVVDNFLNSFIIIIIIKWDWMGFMAFHVFMSLLCVVKCICLNTWFKSFSSFI